MKIKFFSLLMLWIIPLISFSQKIYNTYYDYNKTHVKEEYAANSYGVKNGLYKMFSEYGGIMVQGTYKDDKADGVWEVFSDKGKIKSKLNYKNDLLDGAAIYYDENGNKKLEGDFTNGLKTGNWYLYEIYQATNVPKSSLVGCQYVKTLVHYNEEIDDDPDLVLDPGSRQDRIYGGELAQYDHKNKIIDIFYPSGKKYQDGNIANNILGGRYFYRYYPNGKLEQFDVIDTTNDKVLLEKIWQWPGVIEDSSSVFKEPFIKAATELAAKKAETKQKIKIKSYTLKFFPNGDVDEIEFDSIGYFYTYEYSAHISNQLYRVSKVEILGASKDRNLRWTYGYNIAVVVNDPTINLPDGSVCQIEKTYYDNSSNVSSWKTLLGFDDLRNPQNRNDTICKIGVEFYKLNPLGK